MGDNDSKDNNINLNVKKVLAKQNEDCKKRCTTGKEII